MSDFRIDADHFHAGADSSIGERTVISAIGGPAESVVIGDNVQIGPDVRILAPRVHIGDYTVIHHHTTIYGYDEVIIGDCCWVGQNVVLNCTAPLRIGRGCTLSAYCNLWTHFAGGDPVEGCNYDRVRPATIGADVWIGVQASIAPVNIGAKSLIMAGAVVTHDVPANTTFAGNPAIDISGKIGTPYSHRTVEQKFEHMCGLLREFATQRAALTSVSSSAGDEAFTAVEHDGVFTIDGITITMTDVTQNGRSVFDVRDRTYSKLRTLEEISFMQFLLPLVKFYPRGNGEEEGDGE